MQAHSRIPQSAQTGIHSQLPALLERHLNTAFRKPYADYNRAACAASLGRRERIAPQAPLILDAGCGVGESSIALARAFPGHYVIGVDQSASRLARRIADKRECLPPNLDLVRADLVDFWRLLCDAGVSLDRHYLLYPNPWPKIGHLSRRWQGHPVFPFLLQLGGRFECRSNWRIYIEEMAFALSYAGMGEVLQESFTPLAPLTPFERKYQASGHPLYRLSADLRSGVAKNWGRGGAG